MAFYAKESQSGTRKVGTIGFAYPEWVGKFYPPQCQDSQRLRSYASQFPVVELDTTFYGVPKFERIRRWATQVPPGFRFYLKAPQAITHSTTAGAKAEADNGRALADFCQLIEAALGDRLGGILLQFPASFASNRRYALDYMIGSASAYPLMVEFRHASWWQDSVVKLLEKNKVVWVAADLAGEGQGWKVPNGEIPFEPQDTGPFVYLRCCGKHGQYERDDQELGDVTPRLEWWMDRLGKVVDPKKPLVVTFGNSFAGFAPASCHRCLTLFGLPLPTQAQSSLFD